MKEILSHWVIWLIVCAAVNLIANPIVNKFNNDHIISIFFPPAKPSVGFEYLAKFLVFIQFSTIVVTFLSVLFCFISALK